MAGAAEGFPTPGRKGLMVFLVSMFVLQTALVYRDDTGRETPPLSAAALAGREVWLRHNCQACHQFYGFGGFLGPDLTNAASRVDRERLEQILTYGRAQMPAFYLNGADIDAVAAYLREMDATGVGQARVPSPSKDAFEAAVRDAMAAGGMPYDAVAGADRFMSGPCIGCHAPLGARRIGNFLAPDLSASVRDLPDAELLAVLEQGRPERGMPPTGLDAAGRREVAAFLRWLGDRREQLADQMRAGRDGGLPWWEFR